MLFSMATRSNGCGNCPVDVKEVRHNWVPTRPSLFHDTRFLVWLHQPPGFAVLFVSVEGFAGGVGMETEALAPQRRFDGDEVPGVLGDDISGDEINFILGVNVDTSPTAVRTDLVATTSDGGAGARPGLKSGMWWCARLVVASQSIS